MIKMLSEINATQRVIKDIPNIEGFFKTPTLRGRILNFPRVRFSPLLMPFWQQKVKRGMDIILSLLGIITLTPIYLLTAIGVKLNSRGPILFKQQRIGMNGIPFEMIKFRTMYVNSEQQGPQLASKNDPRITSFGKVLRMVRLDEIPQLFTVFNGTMSLVGPRPEREYYINQIVEKAPHYLLLLKVKPGLTSWGQIKYGYAENITQMLERLKFDMSYIENMSILTDFKILVKTIIVVFEASGR